MNKVINKLSKQTREKIKSFFYMTIGVMISAIAFSFFLDPANIVIGGVSGLGVIFRYLYEIDSAIVMLIINIVLLILSLAFVGKEFFIKTIYGAIAFPFFVWIFDELYSFLVRNIDNFGAENLDLIILILFSSIIMGYGLGLAVKHGGSTGGTEIPQMIFYKKFHMPYSVSLYLIDGTIIILGFFLINQKIEIVLYEIVFVVISGFIMDTTIFSGFNKRSVNIISDKCEEIKNVLLKDFGRGVTSIKVVGEFSKKDKKMIVCLMSTLEYYKLRELIENIDPKAFFYCMRASEVRGEGFTYESESEL